METNGAYQDGCSRISLKQGVTESLGYVYENMKNYKLCFFARLLLESSTAEKCEWVNDCVTISNVKEGISETDRNRHTVFSGLEKGTGWIVQMKTSFK